MGSARIPGGSDGGGPINLQIEAAVLAAYCAPSS